MDLSIIIVNYNVPNEVNECLKSINKVLKGINFEVIIIDNNSTDKSIYDAVKDYYKINLIALDENVGFGRANNKGVENANGNYILFLNPDTILIQDFITPIIDFIEKNKDIGACAPMLTYPDNSYQSSTGFKMGLLYEFLEAFMLIGAVRRIMKSRFLKRRDDIIPVKVRWLSGACLIIKKSVFEKVGGFTEDYFLNYEDIDLCRKLELAGFSNYYFPYLKCIHSDHKSFGKNFSLLVYSRYKSRLVYAKHHYNYVIASLVRLIHIAGILSRLLFVNLLYSGFERKSRWYGYACSLKLYVTGIDSIDHLLIRKVK